MPRKYSLEEKMRKTMDQPDVEIIECPHRVVGEVVRPEILATKMYEQSLQCRCRCN